MPRPETKGLKKAIADLRNGLGIKSYVVRHGVKASGERSASENMAIWKRHAENERDPFLFDMSEMKRTIDKGITKHVKTGHGLKESAERLGKKAQETIVGNVNTGKGIKPLRGSWYAEWKAKKHPGKPVMVLTGALLDSLKVIVKER